MYRKYGLTEEEIEFVEETIRPLDGNEEADLGNSVMTVLDDEIIRYYGPTGNELDINTVGSWRIPFDGKENAARICKDAIKAGAVAACAHDNRESGLICFYVDGTSDDAQRALLTWLRDNNLLLRNPDGSFVDIPYVYDMRSADNITSDAKLADFIDLQRSMRLTSLPQSFKNL